MDATLAREAPGVPIGDDVIEEGTTEELEATQAAARHGADHDDATMTSVAPRAEDVET
jgi:hypothetical protein